MALASMTALEKDCSRLSNMTVVGLRCSNLLRCCALSTFHSWSYRRYWSSCLLTRPKVFSMARVSVSWSPTTSGDRSRSERKEKTTGSSSSLTNCGGVSMQVPSIQRTKERQHST